MYILICIYVLYNIYNMKNLKIGGKGPNSATMLSDKDLRK